jgi:hypothetical protein
MTSPTIPESAQPDLEGRSLRDVVEYSPEQVNDAWCRKIFRKILQSLELQYTMEMPHRAITSDTIVFHANGEPLLISDDIDAAPAPDAQQADDLTALASVIHYAITHELTPAGPLHGRAAGYSAALVAAVDACMDPDPARRPRSFDAVRGLLGIDAPEPLAGAVTLPAAVSSVPHVSAVPHVSSVPHVSAAASSASALPPVLTPAPVERMPEPIAAVAAPHARTRRGPRWAIAAGGGAIAIALALVLVAERRDAGPHENIVVTPPQAGKRADPVPPAPDIAASVDTVTPDARTDQTPTARADGPAASAPKNVIASVPANQANNRANNRADSPASGTSSVGTTHSSGDADQPESVAERAVVPPGAATANASYQLQIKPWGTVYVDGVERGASPPLKRLALTPGPHTIRITNPKYHDSILEFESAQTTSNGKIIVDFDQEAQ